MGFPENTVHPMSVEQLKESKKVLAKLTTADQLMKKIALSKNELESYIYAVRAESYEEYFEEVTTEEQRETLTNALRAAEDWLFEQEDDGFEKFNTKLKDIKDMSEPVYTRIREAVERPKAVNKTATLITYTREMVTDFEKERPWIPQEDKDKVLKMVDEVEAFLKKKEAEQAALKPYDKPAYLSHKLIAKLKPVAKFSAELLRRPKPKPRRRRRKAQNTTDTNTTDSNTTETKTGEETKEETKKETKEETKEEKKEL